MYSQQQSHAKQSGCARRNSGHLRCPSRFSAAQLPGARAPHGRRSRGSLAPHARLSLLRWPGSQHRCGRLTFRVSMSLLGCSGPGRFPRRPQRLLPSAQHLPPHSTLKGARERIQALPMDSRGNTLDAEGFLQRLDSWLQAGAPRPCSRRVTSLSGIAGSSPFPGQASIRPLQGAHLRCGHLTAWSSLAGIPPSRALAPLLVPAQPGEAQKARHRPLCCVESFLPCCHHGSFTEKAASLPRGAGSAIRL